MIYVFPGLPEDMKFTLVSMTIGWFCGHTTDHGSVERPVRCPVCSCDRIRIAHIKEEAE